jgi:hypothetical protein
MHLDISHWTSFMSPKRSAAPQEAKVFLTKCVPATAGFRKFLQSAGAKACGCCCKPVRRLRDAVNAAHLFQL